ncbi:hypothetical protein RHSIM_RhsimUnG0137400 [Rhododendron simsii]|uniref:Uncharacterized protein n=1 Tax=Rhododendron simsii TaxID=118357 RepID=A0A834FVP1_RHOSS|nr:hypothetical protein RHSIM_RhsimUnG0137400 [Rhododendron simsii]
MNYTDSSIRLVGVGIQTDDICSSFPLSNLTHGNFRGFPYEGILLPYIAERTARTVVFLSCEYPIQSPAYVSRTGYNCSAGDESSGNGYYSYVGVGVRAWDFPDWCTFDQVAITSSPRLVSAGASSRGSTMSWLDLNKELAYGFEASWGNKSGTCIACKERFYELYRTLSYTSECGNCTFEPPFQSE